MHGQDEGGFTAAAVGRVDEGLTDEDPVLYEYRRELAGADAHESEARGRGALGFREEPALRAPCPPADQSRRMQVPLPRMRSDPMAEEGSVFAPEQAVATALLLVRPADRQVRHALDLVQDDRAVAHGRTDERVAPLS
jgi:hypothetical protein